MVRIDPNFEMRVISRKLLEKATSEKQHKTFIDGLHKTLDNNAFQEFYKHSLSAALRILDYTLVYLKNLGLFEDWKQCLKSKNDRNIDIGLFSLEMDYKKRKGEKLSDLKI